MTSLKRPGVYIRETSSLPKSVASVKTAIPAFIGYTENDNLLNIPTKINSLLDYKDKFGDAPPQKFTLALNDTFIEGELTSRVYTVDDPKASMFKLYHSLELYFNNGGGSCYIVSVGNYDTEKIEVGRKEPMEGIIGGIAATEEVDEITLYVFPDAISLADETEYGFVVKNALAMCNKLKDRFTVCDVFDNGTSSAIPDFRSELGVDHLKNGAAYYPLLKTSFNYQLDKDNSIITHTKIEDDAPPVSSSFHNKSLRELEELNQQIYNGFETEIKKNFIILPASGAIAGVYVRVDSHRGVWKAPANVGLNSVLEPTIDVNNYQQDKLNVDASTGKSINVIRNFAGRRILVWSARTLDGNNNEWRYIPIRRLCITIEESVKKAIQSYVNEPNGANTWVSVRAMIENYLILLWRDGALAGSKPEDAFYVRVGLGQTMTAQDILEGIMNVEIGMSAVRPAEFITLKLSFKMEDS